MPFLPFIVFWCVSKKWGYRYLATLGIGELVNGVVKLTVCAYRPWIRSDLIEPAGDSKVAATGYSFPPIVSFGINSTDPHHMPDNTALKEGDLVLFDVGCVVEDYCSDMTRTYFYKKEPTADQRRVYELVLKANTEAEAMLKPGIVIADIDKKARDIITDGGFGKFFTHRLGHFIGLQDHEFGDVSQANHNLTEPGNIFSIEPGIYDPATAGVRIEDLVLITEDGYENLNALPKELEVIE